MEMARTFPFCCAHLDQFLYIPWIFTSICNLMYGIAKSLAQLSPNSSAIQNHIRRSFFILQQIISFLEENSSVLSPSNHGWYSHDGNLLPLKDLNPIPASMFIICKCAGKYSDDVVVSKLSRCVFCLSQIA